MLTAYSSSTLFFAAAGAYSMLLILTIWAVVFGRLRVLPMVREWFLPDSSGAGRVRSRCFYLILLIPFAIIRVGWCLVFAHYLMQEIPTTTDLVVSLALYGASVWAFFCTKGALVMASIYVRPRWTRGSPSSTTTSTRFLIFFVVASAVSGVAIFTTFAACIICTLNYWQFTDHFSDLWGTGATFELCGQWSMAAEGSIAVCALLAGVGSTIAWVAVQYSGKVRRRAALLLTRENGFLAQQKRAISQVAGVAICSCLLRAGYQAFLCIPSTSRLSLSGSAGESNLTILIELVVVEVIPFAVILGILHMSILAERRLVWRESSETREMRPRLDM